MGLPSGLCGGAIAVPLLSQASYQRRSLSTDALGHRQGKLHPVVSDPIVPDDALKVVDFSEQLVDGRV